MRTEELTIKAALHISKPAHEVFEAIVNPVQMFSCLSESMVGIWYQSTERCI